LVLHGLWIVPVWHTVVVVHATTDNLTELMSGGGTWLSSICLLAYIVLLGAASASLLSSLAMRSGRALAGSLVVAAISLVLGYFLIWIATEAVVVKYGRVFSALQFLLSTDRSALAAGKELLLRFAVAHLLACVALACAAAAVLAVTTRFAAGRRPQAHHRNGVST